MYAVKIEDIVDNHDLVIPFDKIKGLNHQQVEVIVFPKLTQAIKKQKLSEIFSKYKDVKPFSHIEDVSDWQVKVRNK